MTNTLIEKLKAEIGEEWPEEKERRSLTFEDGLRHAIEIVRQHEAQMNTSVCEHAFEISGSTKPGEWFRFKMRSSQFNQQSI